MKQVFENLNSNVLGIVTEKYDKDAYLEGGDFYVAKKNYFQARHTYQSIVDNYDGQDLVKLAREKIAEVEALEAAENTKNE